MAAPFLQMDAANLFIGDDDPTNSLFLTLKNVNLPDLEERVKEHAGGGAAGAVELGTRIIQPFALTFQLEGFDADRYAEFMPTSPARIKYTVRGNQRDLRTHEDIPILGVVEGRMTKMSTSEFTRENGITTDYEIREIFFYSLHVGGQEKLYYDYWRGIAGVRRNGIPAYGGAARNLGLV